MTDIVKRLRSLNDGNRWPMMSEAADEIERLREQVAALQASSGYEASIAQVEIERLRAVLAKIGKWGDHTGEWALRALEPKP